MMISVTGATGHFGKAAIDFLLKKGEKPSNIIALVRDETKAADLKAKGIVLRKADYTDPVSLGNAFKGVDKLLFVSGSDLNGRSQQHLNVIKAAKESGVGYVVYTSFDRKDETGKSPIAMVAQSHVDTEKALRDSGLNYTILRNGIYADILPMFLGEKVAETGVFFPAGDTPVAFTLRNDMAEAAAAVITGEGHDKREYVVASPEKLTMAEVTGIVGSAVGKELAYTSPSSAVYVQTLEKAGVPAEYVGMFAGFAEAFRLGEFSSEKTDLETLLGHKAGSVRQYLKEVYTAR